MIKYQYSTLLNNFYDVSITENDGLISGWQQVVKAMKKSVYIKNGSANKTEYAKWRDKVRGSTTQEPS